MYLMSLVFICPSELLSDILFCLCLVSSTSVHVYYGGAGSLAGACAGGGAGRGILSATRPDKFIVAGYIESTPTSFGAFQSTRNLTAYIESRSSTTVLLCLECRPIKCIGNIGMYFLLSNRRPAMFHSRVLVYSSAQLVAET